MFIGGGDRVLVFMDLGDLAWTAGVVFIPLLGLFVIPFTAGMTLPKNTPLFDWRTFVDHPLYAVTVAMIAAGWIYSLIVTIVRPIWFNGVVVGTVVALLKLIAATLLAVLSYFVWYTWMNEYRQKRRPNRALIATMFAIVAWIGMCLINGHRVIDRCELLADDS